MSSVQDYVKNLIREATTDEDVMTEMDHLVGQTAFTFISEDKYQASLHDAFVKNFSQRRVGNEYAVKMEFDAFVYVDGREMGKRRIKFSFNTKVKLRHLHNRELYGFVLFRPDHEMGFAYWQPTPKRLLPPDTWYRAKLVGTTFQYTNLTKEMGPVVPYRVKGVVA
jgi:hypothetical protein